MATAIPQHRPHVFGKFMRGLFRCRNLLTGVAELIHPHNRSAPRTQLMPIFFRYPQQFGNHNYRQWLGKVIVQIHLATRRNPVK